MNRKYIIIGAIALAVIALSVGIIVLISSCGSEQTPSETVTEISTEETTETTEEETTSTEEETTETEESTKSSSSTKAETKAEAKTEAETTSRVLVNSTGVIVIDAGHQSSGNSEKEEIGPGATQTKAKVSSGTTGVSTRVPEYKLNLAVALKLKAELESRGHSVIMVRTTNDVNISNKERAMIANNAGAAVLIHIHANGDSNSSTKGALTICPNSIAERDAVLYPEMQLCNSTTKYL